MLGDPATEMADMAKSRSSQGIPGPGEQKAEGLVRAVDRALHILELVSDCRDGIALPSLASKADLATSTVHRLLTTLQDRGFVRFEKAIGRWFVGSTALSVGAGYAGSRDMVACAQPIIRRLGRNSGATVNLGMLDAGKVIFLHRFDARTGHAFVPTGKSLPAHCSSIGKALLALLPLSEVEETLVPERLVPVTPNTICSAGALMTSFEETRRVGFALDDEENTIGLRCIAAPVFDVYHRPVAAISIAAPVERLNLGQVADCGRNVAAAARELTRVWAGIGG